MASTSEHLMLSLCDHLEGILKDYVFPAPAGDPVDAQVFLHGLPETQADHCFPFVCVRWMQGSMVDDGQQTIYRDTIALALGVHAPESQRQAGLLLAELVDCLRLGLWRGPRILAKRYELESPIETVMPDAKQKWHEYHLATMETHWNYIGPSRGMFEMTQNKYPEIRS